MFNVNQITAQLAKMPDQALQQYAAMHKSDPYTVALALAEANRRKEIRAGGHAQFMQPPKVVDKEIEDMAQPVQVMSGYGVPVTSGDGTPVMAGLPENSGIGKLPAKNLEKMAGGGIVAFEEGGEVPRYQGVTDGSLVQLPGGLGIYGQGQFGSQQGDAELNDRIARIEANPRMTRADKDMLIGQARAQFGLPKTTTIPPTTPVPMGSTAAPVTPAATIPAATAPVATTGTSPRIDKENGVVDAAIERKKREDESAAAGKKLPPEPGLPSVNAYLKQYSDTVYKNAPDKEAMQKEFAAIDKPVVEAMRSSIDKEGARLKSDKEQDFYMSLIQGGLAAAAGDSPNAIQNIAKGFSVGAGNYKEALKDFRKATQENTKAEMELARYEATGKKDALKSYQDQIAKRDDRFAQGVAGIMQQQMQSQATMAHAGAQERLISKIGSDPKFAAAYEKYATTAIGARGDAAILQQYAGPKGEVALRMLEAGTPEQKAYAAQIRQQLKSTMLPAVQNGPGSRG